MKNLTAEQEILFEVALDTDGYETEYDGRMYIHCKYCEANIENDNEHDEDCRIFRARRALGSLWTAYVAEQERKAEEARKEAEREAARQRKRDEEYRRKREKIACDKCGKQVARMGLKDHQQSKGCAKRQRTNEMREGEERTGIECIADPYVNYVGKRCKQCNKPMPNAHPNAVFCSNKGQGNCKDRYHNMSSERVERAREWSGQNARERAQYAKQHTSLEALLAQKCEQEGWDEHKDCW